MDVMLCVLHIEMNCDSAFEKTKQSSSILSPSRRSHTRSLFNNSVFIQHFAATFKRGNRRCITNVEFSGAFCVYVSFFSLVFFFSFFSTPLITSLFEDTFCALVYPCLVHNVHTGIKMITKYIRGVLPIVYWNPDRELGNDWIVTWFRKWNMNEALRYGQWTPINHSW